MEEQRHLNGGHDNAVNVETDSDVEDRNHVEVLRQSRANGRSQPRMDVSALLGERMLQVICRTCCRHICSQVSIALSMSCRTQNHKQYGIFAVGHVVNGHHISLMQGWTLLGDLCPRSACSPLLPWP